MKLSWLQVISWLGLVGLVLGLAGRVYLSAEFPYTHDGENHLARFANYKIALKEGQFPPRLAPNLLNHYTYPVFNYNYPLANILSLPGSIIKLNYELTFKLLALASLGLAVIGIDLWLKTLGFKYSSRWLAILGFSFNPYLLNLTWFRGNIGELLALSLFPWAFWLTELWAKQPNGKLTWWLMFVGAGILLAHNITAMLLLPILILHGWGRIENYFDVKGWVRRFQLGLIWLGSILLSLWFWLPALVEKSFIVLDNLDFSTETSKYFSTWSQLIFSPLEFGFAYPGSVDGLSSGLGLLTWVAIAITLLWLLVWGIKRKFQKLETMMAYYFLAVIGLIWLQTQASNWIWEIFTPLKFLQFPWRLGLPVVMLSLPLIAYTSHQIKKFNLNWLRWLVILLIVFQLKSVFSLKPADTFHKQIQDYDAFVQTTSTNNENLPKGFYYPNFADWQPAPKIETGFGEISVDRWSGTVRNYYLSLKTSSLIIEPSIVFPGFETRAEGQLVTYLDNDQIQGRLAYELPAGNYQVETKFTQNTWARKLANTISLISWIIFLSLISPKIRGLLHVKT